jgi:peptidoglycan/LPS O-acetylase OafA/YrhL
MRIRAHLKTSYENHQVESADCLLRCGSTEYESMHTTTYQSLTYRPDLQGLRAIAILLVLFAHSGLGIVAGGFIGVDVFFVLSGYLITGLLVRELEEKSRIAFLRFYTRRLKRLLPALIVMLGITSVLTIWLLSGVEARTQLAAAPFAATWTSNLYFAFTTQDYFNELASRPLFLHTWSLGVEEQFYLIWPAVLLILSLIGKRRRAGSSGIELVLPGLGILFLFSLAISLYWTINMPQGAFYLMPSRIWQLSLGAIVYLLFRGGSSKGIESIKGLIQAFPLLALGAGLIAIFASAIGLHPNIAYPGFWALVPSFAAALIIAAGHVLHENGRNPLAHPALVWIGDRSYSLYLWHWPIFVLGFSMGLQGQPLPTLTLILLCLSAAILSFQRIELPFWKGRLSHAEPFRVLLLSLLIMAATILAFYYGLRQLPQQANTTDISNQWRMDMPEIYRMPCDAWYAHARVEPCTFGTESAQKTVVFLCDSIGGQWYSVIPSIFPIPHWRTIFLTKSSCALVDEDYFYPRIGKIYQVCTDWRNAVLDEIDRIKPDVLIMGSAATYSFSETQWVEGSSRVLKRLSKAAGKVFIIPGTPSLGFDGPGCVSRNLTPEGRIDRSVCLSKDRQPQITDVARYLEQAASRFPNVHMLNLNDLVCPKAQCNAVNEHGLVVFRDSQHLTDTFVRAQIPIVRERLMRNIKD